MKHLIKCKNGTVCIMHIVNPNRTPDDEIAKWYPHHQIQVEGHCPIKDEDIPKDMYFRDAWIHDGNQIKVDLEKSKDIHREELRRLRKPKLDRLDIKFMRASETGDEDRKKEIIALKQYLRDITQHADLVNAKTPEEVKSFMPSILKEDT